MGTGIVGRESEREALAAFVAGVGDGFATLILEGPAGIGKTTLWRDARAQGERRGVRVLCCRASTGGIGISFAALADLLGPIGVDELGLLPEPQRVALEVALLRRSPETEAVAGAFGPVAAGFLTLIRGLAAAQPLLLAVDDAQWLDQPSRGVVEFAARRLEREAVRLLYTWRTDDWQECTRDPPVSDHPSSLVDANTERLALEPLALPATGRLIGQRLGRVLPRPVIVRIHAASDGNPMLALEIARAVHDRGLGPLSTLPISRDLRAVVASRIAALPDDTRAALRLTAVLQEPRVGMVDLEALAPAEAAGIVEVELDGRLLFTHPLFAAAVYASTPTVERRRLHGLAAQLVSEPEQRARHLALAVDREDEDVARELDETATLAAARGAPAAAAELEELAAARTPAHTTDARAVRLLAAASHHFDAGDSARADARVGDVLKLELPTAIRARALQIAARVRMRTRVAEAMELAEGALELAAGEEPLHGEVSLDLAYCHVQQGTFRAGLSHAQAAVASARTCGDPGLLGDALAVRAMVSFLCGDGLDRDSLTQALRLEEPLRDRTFMMRPSYIEGLLKLWIGELRGSIAALRRVLRETLERGQESSVPLISMYLVWALVWSGELAEAARLADEFGAIAALLDDPTADAIALSSSALVHAHDGHAATARLEANAALERFQELGSRSGAIWPLWALGLLALSERDPTTVDKLLGPLAEQLAQMGAGDPALEMFLPEAVEAQIVLGELDRAGALLEPFAARARALDRTWALAAALRCEGALAAARGDSRGAIATFDQALAEHDRGDPIPLERARTLLLLGQCLRRCKHWGPARRALLDAATTFERHGAPIWASVARSELARAGVAGQPDTELTSTELEVARLVASGLSNREVAKRAFISLKTVEANLTRVYRKLGVRSRVELANAFGEERLRPTRHSN